MPRFTYERPTPSEVATALDHLGMDPLAFARIFGVNRRTMERWMAGQADIPPWVYVTLELLDCQGALSTARHAAASIILRDNLHPERGERPYFRGRLPDDMAEGD